MLYRRACNDARHLPEDCVVAVNISPVQFMTKDFVGMVREVMQSTGIKPERLAADTPRHQLVGTDVGVTASRIGITSLCICLGLMLAALFLAIGPW